jgi:rare lipoprotein A
MLRDLINPFGNSTCKFFFTVGSLACAVFIAAGCASTAASHHPNTALNNQSTAASPLHRNRAEVQGSRSGPTIVTASWYGPGYDGHRTASGERFDPNRLTAASKTLPLGSVLRVTNLKNGRSVNVEINDRGPRARSRSLDLSPAAAQTIGLSGRGVARVKVAPVSRPLSESDVFHLLAGGVYSGRIATLVRARGINFKPTNRDLESLRRAGANKELQHAIATAHVDASQMAASP